MRAKTSAKLTFRFLASSAKLPSPNPPLTATHLLIASRTRHHVCLVSAISCRYEQRSAMTTSTHRDPGNLTIQASTPFALGAMDQSPQFRAAGTAPAVDTPKHQPDTTSDRATAAFVRRTLCSHNVLLGNGERGRTTPRPIEEVLPPLTSSNEVDLQLYGIISVIIKEFVQTWYSKITPDHVFVNEVLQVIAHCTRALEQRLRKVDLEALLLDEVPALLEDHLRCR
jgi:hypothetical protein